MKNVAVMSSAIMNDLCYLGIQLRSMFPRVTPFVCFS